MELFCCFKMGFCILKLIIVISELFEISLAKSKSTEKSKVPLLTYDRTCDSNTQYCYQAFASKVSYSQAWYNCHFLGMHLAMPRTQHQIDFVRNNILGTGDHEEAWIGLIANQSVNSWMWQDNINLAESGVDSWSKGYPKSSRRKRSGKEKTESTTTPTVNFLCVQTDKSGWINDDCLATYQYICQTYTEGCVKGAPYLFGDKCYQLVTANEIASTSLCSNSGGLLAMPKTSVINNYINNINYGGVNVWIGLFRPTGNKDIPFRWMDGDSISEEYLTSHVTNASVTERSGQQPDHYAYMISSGFWNTAYIDEMSGLSYICEYPLMEMDCGTLTISNGNTIYNDTTEGSVHEVMYTSPSSTATCQANGTWYPTPVCSIDKTAFCVCEKEVEEETDLSLEEIINRMIRNLTVDRSQLSKSRRQLTSAEDNRTSSRCLGWSGIVIMTVFCSTFVIFDLINVLGQSILCKPIEFSAVSHQYH